LAERGKPEAHYRAKEHAARDDPIIPRILPSYGTGTRRFQGRINADAWDTDDPVVAVPIESKKYLPKM
jgi:hypothetical protein